MSEPAERTEDDRPLVLDELDEQLERFRLLRKSDDRATDELLGSLGATSAVEREIVLQLSATRALGQPERFPDAHRLAMRALEVLDRNGARPARVPKRLGPLRPVAAALVQLVCRFIVRAHQRELIDAVRNLYDRRLAWCDADDPHRMALLKASRDAHRATPTYKRNPVGLPTFLLGGAAISGVGSALQRILAVASDSSGPGPYLVVLAIAVVFAALSWVALRGAAVARKRILLTVERPMTALWETIGRAGSPPRDQARAFALYAIALTALAWLAVPAILLLVVSAF